MLIKNNRANQIRIIMFMFLFVFSYSYTENRKIDWESEALNDAGLIASRDIETKPKEILGVEDFKLKWLMNSSISEYRDVDKLKKLKGLDFIKVKIKSSSYLSNKYVHDNVYDRNINTVWVEGKNDYGFKEWVSFEYKFGISKKSVSNDGIMPNYVAILPGYAKSEKLFKENNRPKSIVLVVSTSSGGTIIEDNIKYDGAVDAFRLNFKDDMKYHVFSIGNNPYLIGKDFKFTFYIENVYSGSKYNDTCISEICIF